MLTYGLTHIAIVVSDLDVSIAFYDKIFGVNIMYRNETFAQIQTIGSNDIIVFEVDKEKKELIGHSGGIMHFGFRLKNQSDIEQIKQRVLAAGGKIIEEGEFCPGEPYIFFRDPDGYMVEIWYEPSN